jgi:hypothetical protein
MSLPDEKLIWQRIKKLENEDIWTIQQKKRNKIVYVSASDITIDGRITRPERKDVQEYCQFLIGHGIITEKNRPPRNWAGGRKTGRVIMAILAAALPEYIEAFSQNNRYSPGLSGIRLRS